MAQSHLVLVALLAFCVCSVPWSTAQPENSTAGAEKDLVPLVGAIYEMVAEYTEIRGDVGQPNACHTVPGIPTC